MNNCKVSFLKTSEYAKIPTKNNQTDAGYDLYSIEDIMIPAKERKVVQIGLKMMCSEGYYYTFAPRSGLAFKKNLIPSHYNVMDAYFTGDSSPLMFNRSDEDVYIKRGDRICQVLFKEVIDVEFEEVTQDFLDKVDRRGENGFGSSGN